MITPRFWLTQDQKSVTIYIRAPYCSLKDLDVAAEGEIFLFTCSPYYLRLQLPSQIEDNENRRTSFDSDNGEFTFTYEKANYGEYFPNLDLITKLMQMKVDASEGGRKIEMMCSSDTDVVPTRSEYKFGFALRGSCNFQFVSSEFNDVLEIDPFTFDLQERKTMRIQDEQNKFSAEHYLVDAIENDEIQELISLETPWKNLKVGDIIFSQRELDFLKDLSNVSHNLSSEEEAICRSGLIDILYAYCYDRRTTYFEGTCESGWTIVKLCATFCWCEGFSTAKETLISAFRRSLIYPLYREFNLSQCVLCDLRSLIKLGAKYVVKCLINIYDIFLGGSCKRYILNNLYVKNYINYVMHKEQSFWDSVMDELKVLEIRKSDLGLHLLDIERSALRANDLDDKMSGLMLKHYIDEEDSDDEDDTSTDSDVSES